MSGLHILLNVEPTIALMLCAVQWLDWGRTLVFDISAGDAGIFVLRFDDCREMEGEETPMVDFAPGRDAHPSPAQILTGQFGVWLVYGEMEIRLISRGPNT
jgi:hypothetical protein